MKFQDLAEVAAEESLSSPILALWMAQGAHADAARKAARALEKARRQARKAERLARAKGMEIDAATEALKAMRPGREGAALAELKRLTKEGQALEEACGRWQALEERLEKTVRKEYMQLAKVAVKLLPYFHEQM